MSFEEADAKTAGLAGGLAVSTRFPTQGRVTQGRNGGRQLRSLRGMRSADMPESVDVVVVLVDDEVLGYVLDEVVVLGALDVVDALGVLLDVMLLVPVPLIVLELDGVELDEVLGGVFDVSELLPVMLPRVPAPAAAPALVPPGLPPWSPVPALPVVCA